MMMYPGEAGPGKAAAAQSPSQSVSGDPDIESTSVEELRAEVQRLREREQQIIELIGGKSPDKLMHDLRNLLNEVQLLRVLAEQADA